MMKLESQVNVMTQLGHEPRPLDPESRVLEDVMNIYQPDARSYLVWVCIILIHSHIACDTVICFSYFFSLFKSTKKK